MYTTEEFTQITEVNLPDVMTVTMKKYASSIIQLAAIDGTHMEGDGKTFFHVVAFYT